MKRLVMTAVVAVALMVVALPGATLAKDAGKSVCKNGGWQGLVRTDGTTFADQGSCVNYVAQGGTPEAPATFQSTCSDHGGTYTSSGFGLAPVCSWVGISELEFGAAYQALEDYCGPGGPYAVWTPSSDSYIGCGISEV